MVWLRALPASVVCTSLVKTFQGQNAPAYFAAPCVKLKKVLSDLKQLYFTFVKKPSSCSRGEGLGQIRQFFKNFYKDL